MSDSHILLFDPYAGGHHAQYLRMLLDFWVQHQLNGRLDLVLASDFSSFAPELGRFAAEHAEAGIHLSYLPSSDGIQLKSVTDVIRQDLYNGDQVAKAIRDQRPDHCLLMYFDHAQLSLLKGLRLAFPVSISGIYFRPSFHYSELGSPPSSIQEYLDRVGKKWLLAGALRNRHFHTLFSLDPFVVPHINDLAGEEVAVALPDGVSFEEAGCGRTMPSGLTEEKDDRRTVLLFGSLDARKGLFAVLDALPLLPVRIQERLRLRLAGPISQHERPRAVASIARARQLTRVEIHLDDQYIPTSSVQERIAEVDLVLVAYQRHVGSSNVLVRSAAAGKPVLGADFGVVGQQIHRHSLGLAVDTTSPSEISRSLAQFIEQPASIPFDGKSARLFALSNTAEAFAETIFSRLYT